VFLVVAVPTAAMGILGALLIDRLSRNKKYYGELQQLA
jgi:hypothetical protein